MHALTAVPARCRVLEPIDTSAEVGAWSASTAQDLDPELPAETLGRVSRVATVLVDNALRHGAPPVAIEISVSAVVTIEITDHGPGEPRARADGTGSLAEIVNPSTSLWDVTQHDDGSKTVAAVLTIDAAAPRAPRTKAAKS